MSTQSEHLEKQDFKEVGILIKSFRLEKGVTSDDFARQLGISYSTMSRIETGKQGPSAAVLKQLVDMGMDDQELKFSSRPHSKEQTLSYRLAELENKVAKMSETIQKLLEALEGKK